MIDAEVFVLLCWRRMLSDQRLGFRRGVTRGKMACTPDNWYCPLRVKGCPQGAECYALLEAWLGRTMQVLYDQQV